MSAKRTFSMLLVVIFTGIISLIAAQVLAGPDGTDSQQSRPRRGRFMADSGVSGLHFYNRALISLARFFIAY